MIPQTFRFFSTTWGLAMLAFFLWTYQDAWTSGSVVIGFWAIFVVAGLGTFFDSRVAWGVCAIQLIITWVMMGMLVSDQSFEFFLGKRPIDDASTLNLVIMNSFLGIVAPATGLMVLLILCRPHLLWLYQRRELPVPRRRRGRPRPRRRRRRRLSWP